MPPVFPIDVALQVIDVLRTRHAEYLAELERHEALATRTLPGIVVDHLTGDGARTRTDKPGDGALALVGMFIGAAPPVANREDNLDFTWTLAVEVITRGTGREDTIRRRDWYGLTAAECVTANFPRGPASTLEFVGAEMGADAVGDDTADTLAVARFLWDVEVPNTMRLRPLFTVRPADPYDIPESFPPPPNVVRTRVIKEPL